MNKTAEEYEEIIENLMRRMKAWAYLYEEQRSIIEAYKDIIYKYRELAMDDRAISLLV